MDRLISGIKPSGKSLTLGNYIGAIKEFVKYQENLDLFVFIADLHSLTIYNNPDDLRQNILSLAATYAAAGLDINKVTLFKQSDVPAHNQLEWILTCNTNLADLTKMPQFKNYCDCHQGKQVPAGMLLYPSLMNADILLYNADYVPVGLDQKPHVDLTRDVAEVFNKRYGNTFKIPAAVLAQSGAKIMSLTNPEKKMSKSESDSGTIFIFDDNQTIKNKIKKAVTDSENKIYYDPKNKPGISNLLTIHSALSGKTIKELESLYEYSNYGKFKQDIYDIVADALFNIQTNIKKIDEAYLKEVLLKGADKANIEANSTLNRVYKKIGLA